MADAAPEAPEQPAQKDDAQLLLRQIFGHDAFRAGQAEVVHAALAGRDALVVLPTGSGKSLCYQLPALVARARGGGATLVISPLIALMEDQVRALRGRGVRATALHSQVDELEQRAAVADLQTGRLDLLYVAPERAVLSGFRGLLRRISRSRAIRAWVGLKQFGLRPG